MPEHYPVMCPQVLEFLAPKPEDIYLDATAGLLGHSVAIASRLTTGCVIACDRDADSLRLGLEKAAGFADRIRAVHASFSGLRAVLDSLGISKVDGLIADLGANYYQLTDPSRGFSFTADGPLDMRMDRTEQRTADEIVNRYSERDLANLLYEFGQERRRKIARAVVRARPIHSTLQLARVVEEAVPRTGRLHPATKTFMALRIAVNREMEELDHLLCAIPNLVRGGGRVVFLTFHSLEDRRVKRAFQEYARQGRMRILTRHVVRPTPEEVRSNPPSRSAKLRAAELIDWEIKNGEST
ncbi:MAG: 16S rRNA (cytosine(1402)-N(4))-methyltransferase RsmH [Bryobacteraceae bacterium]